MTETEAFEAAVGRGTVAVREGFRAMMRGFPTGVAVVTAVDEAGRPWGLTCSSVCSVALHPPTLLVCVRSQSPTLAAALAGGGFTVNLLHRGAQAVAELFASGRTDRFDLVRWHRDRDAEGPHLTDSVHAVADCRITTTIAAADHIVMIGEVTRVLSSGSDRPLLYGFGRYKSWTTD